LGTLPGRIVDVVAGAAAGSAAVVAALGDPNAEQGLKLIVSVHADRFLIFVADPPSSAISE